MRLHCCKPDCKSAAEYEVRPLDGKRESNSHACFSHISDLMTDATVHEIVKLVAPGDPTPVYV